MAATTQSRLLDNIMDKLDNLPLSFDITSDSELLPSLTDALREMKLTISTVEQDTDTELFLELRSVWWFLFRCRNSSSVNFKYSTGNMDGKSVDKTKVADTMNKIMDDINTQFTDWKSTATPIGGSSANTGVWNATRRTSLTLN